MTLGSKALRTNSFITSDFVARSRAFARCFACVLFFLAGFINNSIAQDATAELQEMLFEQMQRQPTNYPLTFEYVRVASERGDYEAAIGALERLLFYNQRLARVKYQLGALYYRLRAYDMATRYFREALASPDLDPETKAQIEAALIRSAKERQPSRLSAFAQTGLRYQTNASFEPASGVVRFAGQDFGLLPIQAGKSDTNWFGLVGLRHDYDLPELSGSTLETRFLGYGTDQFRFHNLSVALFDASIGPRLPISLPFVSSASIKPYAVGGSTWVGDARYFSSGGGGLAIGMLVTPRFSLEPWFEWRNVAIDTTAPQLSGFASGNWSTAGAASSWFLSDQVRIDSRAYYRRGRADTDFQEFNLWAAEAALIYQFEAPFAIPRAWSITPFGRVIRTAFDAPNPMIDPAITRIDTQWTGGLILATPITSLFGITTTAQFDRTHSTLPNYRQSNFSILSGPTAQF
jgi:hypothetical protein